MKTYKVSWVEYTEHTIQVQVENEEDAMDKAFEEYDYSFSEPQVEPESLEIKEAPA